MGDIAKAYLQEAEYKRLREYGKEPISLLDRVQACGLSTLEEYFSAKVDYQLDHTTFSFQEVYPENAADEMLKMIANGGAGLLLMDTDKTIVYHGDGYYNADYCTEHDIPVLDYKTIGGTLVATSGELSLGICIPNTVDVSLHWLLHKVADYLSRYEGGITVNNNDLLIDGRKFCGATAYRSDYAFAAVAQLSFDDKTDLIKNICGLNENKLPGYLKHVTREQVREALKTWLL